MKPTQSLKIILPVLGPTQEEFAVRCRVSLGTLRDGDQGAKKPDQVARVYPRGGSPAIRQARSALRAPVLQPA